MLDMLCFPTQLEQALEPPAAAEPATAAAGSDAAAAGQQVVPAAKQAPGGGSSSSFSALDGLWALLRDVPRLLDAQPIVAGAVLRVLCALWESPGPAARAVAVLSAQPGFWQSLEVGGGAEVLPPCLRP